MQAQKAKVREQNLRAQAAEAPRSAEADAWGEEPPTSPTIGDDTTAVEPSEKPSTPTTPAANGTPATEYKSPEPKGKGKEGTPVRKFRGVPEDVQLFEVFWQQVVQLIRVSVLSASAPNLLTDGMAGTVRFVYPGYHCTLRLLDESLVELLP